MLFLARWSQFLLGESLGICPSSIQHHSSPLFLKTIVPGGWHGWFAMPGTSDVRDFVFGFVGGRDDDGHRFVMLGERRSCETSADSSAAVHRK